MDDNQNMVNPVQVEKFLSGVNYPANKQALISKARENGADDMVISTLEKLPEQSFESPVDVSQAISQVK